LPWSDQGRGEGKGGKGNEWLVLARVIWTRRSYDLLCVRGGEKESPESLGYIWWYDIPYIATCGGMAVLYSIIHIEWFWRCKWL